MAFGTNGTVLVHMLLLRMLLPCVLTLRLILPGMLTDGIASSYFAGPASHFRVRAFMLRVLQRCAFLFRMRLTSMQPFCVLMPLHAPAFRAHALHASV